MLTKVLCLFVAAMLTSASAVSITQAACQYVVSGKAIYSFLGFEQKNLTLPSGESITFDLCSSAVPSCSTAGLDVTARVEDYQLSSVDDYCYDLADTRPPGVGYADSSSANSGVILTFPTMGSANYELVVSVTCNSSVPTNSIAWSLNSLGNIYTLSGQGAAGCPVFSLEAYLEFFESYKYGFAAIFLIIGLFALLAGLRFFNVTIFIFTSVIISAGLFVIILTLTGLETSQTVQWVVFAICCVIGLGCGYGAVKLEKAGFFALGALLGGVGALFLYGLLLHFFDLSTVILYVIIVLCALIGGGLSLWLWKDIIIIATSCIGSYLIVRGASFYIGGFPSEIGVVSGVESYDYIDYIYLAFMILLAIGGMVFQFRKKIRDQENEKEIHVELNINESISRY